MSFDHDAHTFIEQLAGYLMLSGIVCLALGEGVGPLVGGVLAILFLAAIVGRMRRERRHR
jgi:hypothetical protein